MRTLKLLNNLIKMHLEQGETPAPDATLPQAGTSPAPEAPTPAAAAPTEPLSPEGEVMLIRLLKKALVMDVDENDLNSLDQIGDINETNAKAALQTIIKIMETYSSDTVLKM